MIFKGDKVTSENRRQIASRVTKKSLSVERMNNFYFLRASLCIVEHRILLKTTSIAHFAIVAKDGLS